MRIQSDAATFIVPNRVEVAKKYLTKEPALIIRFFYSKPPTLVAKYVFSMRKKISSWRNLIVGPVNKEEQALKFLLIG